MTDYKKRLYDLFVEYCRTNYRANWMGGCEFVIWQEVMQREDDIFNRNLGLLNEIKHVSDLCEGWWIWEPNKEKPKLIFLNKWFNYYNQNKNDKSRRPAI